MLVSLNTLAFKGFRTYILSMSSFTTWNHVLEKNSIAADKLKKSFAYPGADIVYLQIA